MSLAILVTMNSSSSSIPLQFRVRGNPAHSFKIGRTKGGCVMGSEGLYKLDEAVTFITNLWEHRHDAPAAIGAPASRRG